MTAGASSSADMYQTSRPENADAFNMEDAASIADATSSVETSSTADGVSEGGDEGGRLAGGQDLLEKHEIR